MNIIGDFALRQRIKRYETWTLRAIWILGFFIVLFPTVSTLALMCGIIFWLLRLHADKNFKLRPLPYDLPMGLFTLLCIASVIFSPVRSFEIFYNLLVLVGTYILIYILVGQNIRTPEQVKNLMKGIGTAAIIVVLCGYFQYVFGVDIADMKWIDGEVFPELRKRIFSTLENPNVLAGYLDVMICIALGLLARYGDRRQKLILTVIILMLSACLAMTYSRGAFLTLGVVFFIYGIIQDWRIFILFTLITGVIIYSDSNFSYRIISIFTDTLDSSEGLRIGIWVSTIPMIADHPFTGVGWGAFKYIYPQYNYYLEDPNITIYHAHNLYLNTAAEVGIVGAMAYFWFFFGTMFMALNLSANRRFKKIMDYVQGVLLYIWIKFDAAIWQPLTKSKLFKRLDIIKKQWSKRLENLFATDKKDVESKAEEYRDPNLVHHDELKGGSKHRKKADEKADDNDNDKFDLQKFAKDVTKDIKEFRDKRFIQGIRFGIGLAFLSMAINGLSDDLLFNMQSSMLMWLLAAVAAACQAILRSENN